jgi:hypothetical protein
LFGHKKSPSKCACGKKRHPWRFFPFVVLVAPKPRLAYGKQPNTALLGGKYAQIV